MPPRGIRLVGSLVGMRFGHLEVIEEAQNRNDRVQRYVCRCDCGGTVYKTSWRLRHKGNAQACQACVRRNRPLPDDRQRIVEQHLEWAYLVAWKWKKSWRRLEDDIDSAVHEAIVTAARDFDETRGGGNFEQFCYMRMAKEIARTIAKIKKHEFFCDSVIATLERISGS